MIRIVATLIALVWASVAVAGQGVAIVGSTSPVDGVGRLQVVVTDVSLRSDLLARPHPSRFQAVVGHGGARVTAATPLADTGQGTTTLLAVDASGSFKPYWSDAFDLARAFAAAMPAGDRGEVVTIGTGLDRHGIVATSADLIAQVDAVATSIDDENATRLKSLVLQAIQAVGAEAPQTRGGARQVVVFTDGGDESSAYDVAEVIGAARALGVRVHVVVFYDDQRMGQTQAQRLDEMMRLAQGTGGTYVDTADLDAARARIAAIAGASAGTWWLDLAFCGVPAGPEHLSDTIAVEIPDGPARAAWSEPVPFRQHAAGSALAPCAAPTVTGAAAVADTDQDAPVASSSAGGRPWWIAGLACLGLSLVGLLGLLGLLALWRNRDRRDPPPSAAPDPTTPTAPAPSSGTTGPAASPPPAPWRDPFATLPEIHLVVTRGGGRLQPFYRVHRSPFTLGSEPSAGVDLVLDVPQVSGRHCTLQVYKNGNVWLTDEHSTNGTFVDGRRLAPGERVPVQPGQRIEVSRHLELRLDRPGAAPNAPDPETPPGPPPRNRTVYAPVKKDP